MKATVFATAMAIICGTATSVAALDLNPLSLLKGAVEALVEDRSSEDIGKDAEIKARIVAKVIDKMASDVIAINADVYEQDVMLTGSVETRRQRTEAGTLARSVGGHVFLFGRALSAAELNKAARVVRGIEGVTRISNRVKIRPKS